jgi:hypothetical protein
MGTTPTRDLGTALSAGLLGGVKSYQDLDKSLADLEQKREEIPKVAAQTDVEKMRALQLQGTLYERRFITGQGDFIIDKSKPGSPRIKVADAQMRPIPHAKFDSFLSFVPRSKDSDPLPSGAATTPTTGEASVAPDLPNQDAVPTLKSKNVLEWDSKFAEENYADPLKFASKEQLPLAFDDESRKRQATVDAPLMEEYRRKASSAKDQLMQIELMQQQYDKLSQEGFLVGGKGARQRLEYANAVNTALRALGARPLFSNLDEGALESLLKDQSKLGFALSNSIGSREPGVIVQQAISANPGIENSPDGFRIILAGMKENAQREKDRGSYYERYFNRYGNLAGANEVFEKTNPSDMYARRSVATAIKSNPAFPAGTIEALKQYGPDAAPKGRPELSLRNKIDEKYGAGTTDYILGKK